MSCLCSTTCCSRSPDPLPLNRDCRPVSRRPSSLKDPGSVPTCPGDAARTGHVDANSRPPPAPCRGHHGRHHRPCPPSSTIRGMGCSTTTCSSPAGGPIHAVTVMGTRSRGDTCSVADRAHRGAAADDEQGWGGDPCQLSIGEIGAAATRHHRRDVAAKLGSGHQCGCCAGGRPEVADRRTVHLGLSHQPARNSCTVSPGPTGTARTTCRAP